MNISSSALLMLMRDGTQIVAVLGPHIHTAISAFGDTAIEALRDLVGHMECKKFRLEGIDF